MEELVNENQTAPKVEKISLAELRAEAAKLNEEENRYLQEQKDFEEKLIKKNKEKEEKFLKEFNVWIDSVNTLSPEEQNVVIEKIKKL